MKVVVWVAVAGAVSLLGGGCFGAPAGFACTLDDQCELDGIAGHCEPSGACSQLDPGCASGRRYEPNAIPVLAGVCVDQATPYVLWTAGGPGHDELTGLVYRDRVVAASITYEPGALDLSGAPLPSYGEVDMMVVAIDSVGGTVLWSRTFGGPETDFLTTVEFLGGGDVVVGGRVNTDQSLGGNTVLDVTGSAASFVVRFGSDGSWKRATISTGGGVAGIAGVTAGTNNSMFALGNFSAPISAPIYLDPAGPPMSGQWPMFVAHYDGSGAIQSQRSFGTGCIDPSFACYLPRAIMSSTSTIITTGEFSKPLTVGTKTVTPVRDNDPDVFVATFPAGNLETMSPAMFSAGGVGFDRIEGVSVPASGSPLVIAGSSPGAIDFTCSGCAFAPSAAADRIGWIVELTSDTVLVPRWAKPLGDAGTTEVTAVAIGSDGALYVAGKFNGTVTFDGSGARTSEGGFDGFVGALERDHSFRWVATLAGPGDETFHELVIDPDGRLIAGGGFDPGARLGDVLLNHNTRDVIIAAFRMP